MARPALRWFGLRRIRRTPPKRQFGAVVCAETVAPTDARCASWPPRSSAHVAGNVDVLVRVCVACVQGGAQFETQRRRSHCRATLACRRRAAAVFHEHAPAPSDTCKMRALRIDQTRWEATAARARADARSAWGSRLTGFIGQCRRGGDGAAFDAWRPSAAATGPSARGRNDEARKMRCFLSTTANALPAASGDSEMPRNNVPSGLSAKRNMLQHGGLGAPVQIDQQVAATHQVRAARTAGRAARCGRRTAPSRAIAFTTRKLSPSATKNLRIRAGESRRC